MLNLLREGGVPMWFVIAFGALSLLAAFAYARKGDRRCVDYIGWMSAATLFSIAGGVASDLAAVGHHALRDRLRARPVLRRPVRR